PDVIAALENSGDVAILETASTTPPASALEAQAAEIDSFFGGETLADILNALRASDSEFAADTLKKMQRSSPLAMACTIEVIHRLRGPSLSIEKALDMEYRFTFRAMQQGDFLEGIRAQIIDKDRNPQWQYPDMAVPMMTMSQMLFPLKDAALTFKKDQT
ncbi:MAG: enoyl-CoA hydratase/isomerase family protein, partial [Marinomonas sp.]